MTIRDYFDSIAKSFEFGAHKNPLLKNPNFKDELVRLKTENYINVTSKLPEDIKIKPGQELSKKNHAVVVKIKNLGVYIISTRFLANNLKVDERDVFELHNKKKLESLINDHLGQINISPDKSNTSMKPVEENLLHFLASDQSSQNGIATEGTRMRLAFEILCENVILNQLNVVLLDFKPENLVCEKDKYYYHLYLPQLPQKINYDEAFSIADKLDDPLAGMSIHPNFINEKDMETLKIAFKKARNTSLSEKERNKYKQQYADMLKKMSTFALGASLYVLFSHGMKDSTHPLPYEAKPYANASHGMNLNDLHQAEVPHEIIEEISKMLDPDPAKRPGPKEASNAIMDRILKSNRVPLKAKTGLRMMRENMQQVFNENKPLTDLRAIRPSGDNFFFPLISPPPGGVVA